jgi:hypothetical protein
MTTTAEQHHRTDAELVLARYRAEYVRIGYMYAGEMSPDYAGRVTGLDFDRALAAIKQLLADGVLRRRKCLSWTYELVPAERLKLINASGLRERWEAEAPYFYPNSPVYGEIPFVLREMAVAQVAELGQYAGDGAR